MCTYTTTVYPYPLNSWGPGRLLATFICPLLPSLRPLMFESVSPLIVSLSLVVDMLFLDIPLVVVFTTYIGVEIVY